VLRFAVERRDVIHTVTSRDRCAHSFALEQITPNDFDSRCSQRRRLALVANQRHNVAPTPAQRERQVTSGKPRRSRN
jgi:hypothetical protein